MVLKLADLCDCPHIILHFASFGIDGVSHFASFWDLLLELRVIKNNQNVIKNQYETLDRIK